MAQTRTRTQVRRHRETDWEKFCRLLKRRVRKSIRANLPKIILVVLILVMGMTAGVFIGVRATNYAQTTKINDYGRHQTYTAYTVKYGDTIWDIASDLAALNPEYNDVRQYVSEIKRLNNLRNGQIKAGDTILIPYFINSDGTVSHDEIYSKYGIGQ